MTEEISYIESKSLEPYYNLAVEEYLLKSCKEHQCILYLWQNKKTVVIGRNQNVWSECLADRLEEDGGHLARRLSGGGAVYQDTGNLNFTFLSGKADYDVAKQFEVILKAVWKLGVRAERAGRNDVLAGGRKFSGNAFYEQGTQCYHHGTLMVDVDIENLSKYLTVSKEKLESKGVASVKSRVMNLAEAAPDITVLALKQKLLEAFQEVYGLQAGILGPEDMDQIQIGAFRDRFASWDFIYGRRFPFQHELSQRFPWGQIDLKLQVNNGRVEDAAAYSDAMKPDIILELAGCLKGAAYHKQSILERIATIKPRDAGEKEMAEDIFKWIKNVDL